MDPKYCENVELCDKCQSTFKVQSHCKHCHVNICKNCAEKHRSEGNTKHEIVSIDDVCPSLHLTKCETHEQQYCLLDCKDCHKSICFSCIGTEQHSGHQIEEIENIVKVLSIHSQYSSSNQNVVDKMKIKTVQHRGHQVEEFNSKNVRKTCHECQSTLKVQSHCKICRLNICKYCVESHVSNDDKVHKIVSIDEICPYSNLTKCKTHNQIVCTFECKACHKSMCSLCIRSGHHRGHQVEEVAHIVKVSSTYIVETDRPSETTNDLDKMNTCSKHITSTKLRDVFNSFQVGFLDDPLNESFVHKILNVDFLRGLKVEINSLATGIMLITNINREHLVKPGDVCVFELDVINEGDQLVVIQKVHVQCYNYQASNHLHFCCFF